MNEKKCSKGVIIENIGSIQCSTCESMIKDGYCTELKTVRIEKEKKINNKLQYCEDCIYYTTEKISLYYSRLGFTGRCVNRGIYLILNNKSCDRGKSKRD